MILVSIVLSVLLGLIYPIPNEVFDNPYSTVLEDSNGNLLGARIANDGQWRFPEIDFVPHKMQLATLIYEDKYFFKHFGVNPISILRAVWLNIKNGKVISGGSTITMQVARMASGNRERTYFQKLKEVWLALKLEVQFSKKEILELYINHAPYGGNVVGLQAASWRYYGRSPKHLSWAEAANLAVLPNAPSLVFPGKNDSSLLNKRNSLLEKLYNHGELTKTEYELSLLEPIPSAPKKLPGHAHHLLSRAIKEGHSQTIVKSTINMDLQLEVQKLVNQYHIGLSSKQINNAAVLVTEIETGNVLAYVGNVGINRNHGVDVDIINSKRSPGSLLKPLLYALAIDEGYIMPNQLLPDVPLYYRGFAPKNFDKSYNGVVRANAALRSSLNIPFVYLLNEYGYEKFYSKLRKMGVNSLSFEPGHYGLTLVLGGGELSMWEISALYAGLVRNSRGSGVENNWMSNNYVVGTPLDQNNEQLSLSPSAAWHTLKAMQELRRPDKESNWQRFGSARPIAWKTGTSYGHKDAWAVGVNSKYVVSVWIGNADGEGRPDLVGVTAASPLMFNVFGLLDGDSDFPAPNSDMVAISICDESGMKTGEHCGSSRLQFVSKSSTLTNKCTFHQQIHLDSTLTYRVNAECYPVSKMVRQPWFVLPPAQAWYYRRRNIDHIILPDFAPNCMSGEPLMQIIYPQHSAQVFVPIEIDQQRGRVVLEAAHQNPNSKLFWHLDNEFIGITNGDHHIGVFPDGGKHKLSIIDESGQELEIEFEVLSSSTR